MYNTPYDKLPVRDLTRSNPSSRACDLLCLIMILKIIITIVVDLVDFYYFYVRKKNGSLHKRSLKRERTRRSLYRVLRRYYDVREENHTTVMCHRRVNIMLRQWDRTNRTPVGLPVVVVLYLWADTRTKNEVITTIGLEFRCTCVYLFLDDTFIQCSLSLSLI